MTCNHICVECGKHETGNWTHADVLTTYQLCFDCNFWSNHAMDRDEPNTVRIDGTHYYVGPEGINRFNGHGGRRFRIRFNDGREVITTNLWCQGDIPEHFRTNHGMTDNAVFLEA